MKRGGTGNKKKRKARRRGSSSARIAQRAATPACQFPKVGVVKKSRSQRQMQKARLTNWGGWMRGSPTIFRWRDWSPDVWMLLSHTLVSMGCIARDFVSPPLQYCGRGCTWLFLAGKETWRRSWWGWDGYRTMYTDKWYGLCWAVMVGDVSQRLSFIYPYKNVYNDERILRAFPDNLTLIYKTPSAISRQLW